MLYSFAKIWFARCLVVIIALNGLSLGDAVFVATAQQTQTSAAGQQPHFSAASDQQIEPIFAGIVTTILGQATATSNDGSRVRALKIASAIYTGETIRTDFSGSLKLTMVDDTIFTLANQSVFQIDKVIYDPERPQAGSSIFTVLQGAYFFISGKIAKTESQNMQVLVPIGSIGIRGTAVAGNIYVDGSDIMGVSLITGAININDTQANESYDIENNFSVFSSNQGEAAVEQQEAATVLLANRAQLSILDEADLAIIEAQLEDEAEIETQQISETITSLRNIIDPEFGLDFPIGFFDGDLTPPQNEGQETLKEILTANAASVNETATDGSDGGDDGGDDGGGGDANQDHYGYMTFAANYDNIETDAALSNNQILNDVNNNSDLTIRNGNAVTRDLISAAMIDGAAVTLSYVHWGMWSSSEPRQLNITSINGASGDAGYGYVVAVSNAAGQYTDRDDLPRTGSANFAGVVQGSFNDHQELGGTIDIAVNLVNDAVIGSMALTKAGNSWANPTFENAILSATAEFSADLSDNNFAALTGSI
ncbi:MAG: FecR domain-containing protein, partial [Alphaproteobacteria bacterium]